MLIRRADSSRPRTASTAADTTTRTPRATETARRTATRKDGFGDATPSLAGENIRPVGNKAASAGPARFELAAVHKTDIPEASGLAFLGAGKGFLVVGDEERAVFHLQVKSGEVTTSTWEPSSGRKKLEGLEGVAFDAERREVLVLSENRASLVVMPLEADGVGDAEELGALPELGGQKNKGWEGVACLPSRLSPDGKAHILGVYEGNPRRLAVLGRDDAREEAVLAFPAAAARVLADVSDVAVDPKTGHVFALTDEGNAVVQLRLSAEMKPREGGRPRATWSLEFVGTQELPTPKGKHPKAEGLAFDEKGDLWVVGETKGMLMQLKRTDG